MPTTAIDPVKNFAQATVVGTYDAAATSITLAAGDGLRFPQSSAFNAIFWNSTTYPNSVKDPNREIVRVTAVNVDTLTVVRGQELADGGLAASPKDTPGVVYQIAQVITAKMINDIQSAAVDVGALTIYVSEKGAKGDGATDDTTALTDSLTDGNHIIFPPGTYLVSAALPLKSNLLIKGAGVGVTTIKLMDNAGAVSMFTGSNISRFTIKDITIDGNETNNPSALDVFDIDGANRCDFENVDIANARKRGIALGDTSGAVTRVRIRNCTIDSCRDHCIEVNNRGSTNLAVSIHNCILTEPGSSGGSAKAGIAAFGRVQISNTYIDEVNGNNYGVWLRADDGTLGAGAHDSNVANVQVFGSRHATDISIGYKIESARCTLEGCYADTLDYGYQVVGDSNSLLGCKGSVADTAFRLEGDQTRLLGSYASVSGSGNTGIDIRATADENMVRNNEIIAASSATAVTYSGTNLHAGNNKGWKTQTTGDSGNFAADSTGVKTWTFAHGLAVTPAVNNCNLSMRWESGSAPTAFANIRGPYVQTTDATNVVVGWQNSVVGDTGVNYRITVTIDAFP